MGNDHHELDIQQLVEEYLTIQKKRTYYQTLLEKTDQRLVELQNQMLRGGSPEKYEALLERVQNRIQGEVDDDRKKACVYLAMIIKDWMERNTSL